MSVSCSSVPLTARTHWLNLYVCAGQSIDGRNSFYISRTDKGNQPGSLSRPQANSILTQTTYHYSCGPQVLGSLPPHALKQQCPESSRVSSKARGDSRKRGCQAEFKVTRLYCWPSIVQLWIQHAAHIYKSGDTAHGDGITQDGVRFQYAPAVSPHLKKWVCTRILAGIPTRQILKEYYKNCFPKIQAGKADRDGFLTLLDIRNINSKLAPLTGKQHQNEAQSVCLFCEQHASNIFIYPEQLSGQSNVPAVNTQPADQTPQLDSLQQSAQLQQIQQFVMGMSPDSMLANLCLERIGDLRITVRVTVGMTVVFSQTPNVRDLASHLQNQKCPMTDTMPHGLRVLVK